MVWKAKRLLTIAQASKRLNVSRATLERLSRAGAFRGATKTGKGWLLPSVAVQAHALRRKLPRVIQPDQPIECRALHCTLTAAACVRRQIKTDAQRPKHLNHGQPIFRRGVAGDHPTCDTATCPQGAAIRAQIDPNANVRWIGSGLRKRFEPKRHDVFQQVAAAHALAIVGLLDVVPTCDGARPLVEGELSWP